MANVTRWVGSSISTVKERGLVPIGRQRRYGAVELAGAGEQVNVNDVVEVGGGDGIIKMEIDQPGASPQHLRLAQVGGSWSQQESDNNKRSVSHHIRVPSTRTSTRTHFR